MYRFVISIALRSAISNTHLILYNHQVLETPYWPRNENSSAGNYSVGIKTRPRFRNFIWTGNSELGNLKNTFTCISSSQKFSNNYFFSNGEYCTLFAKNILYLRAIRFTRRASDRIEYYDRAHRCTYFFKWEYALSKRTIFSLLQFSMICRRKKPTKCYQRKFLRDCNSKVRVYLLLIRRFHSVFSVFFTR